MTSAFVVVTDAADVAVDVGGLDLIRRTGHRAQHPGTKGGEKGQVEARGGKGVGAKVAAGIEISSFQIPSQQPSPFGRAAASETITHSDCHNSDGSCPLSQRQSGSPPGRDTEL